MTWQRLSARTAVVRATWLLPPLGSALLAALASGGNLDARCWILVGSTGLTFAVITLSGLLRLRTTRYRLTADALETRVRLLGSRTRTVPLTRIRYADLTAGPVHRLLGLEVLRVGTAGAGDLVLDALPREEARRLRERLAAQSDGDRTVLSAMNLRWLRYAPLTFWVFGGVGIVVGSAFRLLDQLGLEPWRIPVVARVFTDYGPGALWLAIPLTVLGVAVIGGIGATAVYLENWWRFRLTRSDPETLRVTRGLFTTRSVSMERRLLRGAELAEPLLLRAGGGASVRAVAGGLGDAEEARARSRVLPPAPRAEAVAVATALLGTSPEVALLPHPRAARRRRTTRGLLWAVLPFTVAFLVLAALFGPGWLHGAWAWCAASSAATWWLARDAHRSLGHAIAGPHLMIRSGTFSRDTVALDRSGILAWTLSDSPFSRRAGLASLTAAVAAGRHGYRIPDMAADEAAGFADDAAPGILREFLVPGVTFATSGNPTPHPAPLHPS
ncbi:PH domain-containing protein [Phytomonospora endophytica]|uniref:Putative membrane protein n=1 Tax=Phytomonospora endophytica TaxID=714109 RepID=A0A841FEP2_9ACTN|nr:PH domain-containing protein [Phytomonospora endophytica]MBB6034736.1 putative membrane protein [Phytomonospora endophytica]GIG69060.1 hypothetical protein Pen01_53550 [Phytomonospora endophytica]